MAAYGREPCHANHRRDGPYELQVDTVEAVLVSPLRKWATEGATRRDSVMSEFYISLTVKQTIHLRYRRRLPALEHFAVNRRSTYWKLRSVLFHKLRIYFLGCHAKGPE